MISSRIILIYEDKTISDDKYICDDRWLNSITEVAEYLLEVHNNPSKRVITMSIFTGTKPKEKQCQQTEEE